MRLAPRGVFFATANRARRVKLDLSCSPRRGARRWDHVDAEHRARWLPSDSGAAYQRRHRRVTATEVRNSPTVAQYVQFVGEKLTEGLEDGSWECLGLLEDVAARGEMPALLSPLTVEPTKPRLCFALLDLNDASSCPATELEGCQSVQDNAAGGPRYGAACDEANGYGHHRVDAASRTLLGAVFCGYVFVQTVLPFGWKCSCYYHQWHGMVVTSYWRSLGKRVSQYIDDHGLFGAHIGMGHVPLADARRDCYGFYTLKSMYFGYYWSSNKTATDVALSFVILGLRLDTEQQAWFVPPDRLAVYRDLGGSLLRCLADGSAVHLHTLSRFAGKTVYYRRVCRTLRRHQNLQYSVLSGRRLHGEIDAAEPRWWLVTGRSQRTLSRGLRQLLRREIETCVALVDPRRVHPFVGDGHTTTLVTVVHYSDTTLDRFGAVIRPTPRPGVSTPPPEVLFSGVLPEHVLGVLIARRNTGVVEEAGLVYELAAIDANPELRAHYENGRADFYLDNDEDVRLLSTGRVGGVHTAEKTELMWYVDHFMAKWNCHATFQYVHTLLNPADEGSRLLYKGEVRLLSAVFLALWRACGPFDVDGFASLATRQTGPDGSALPYVSRTYDPESRSINFLAQDWGRDSAGRRERLYLNPPFVMGRSAVRWAAHHRAHGVVVVPVLAPPLPAWRELLSRHTTRCWLLPTPHSEKRQPEGFVVQPCLPPVMACEFDFAVERLTAAEVEELPVG